jgi:geranylgeranyl diphosphate synthase type II
MISSDQGTLAYYQAFVRDKIEENMTVFGPKTKLRDACEYALTNGGKRLRPAITLMVSKALGYGADAVPAALAVEYFHTASLVVDDLPCMDDDDERRCKPSVHKLFGESTALLVSYALIAAGYKCIANNALMLKHSSLPHASYGDQIGILVLENASHNTGLQGATGGQFLDIFPPDLSLPTLRDVIHKKTVSLFEISFVSGWLFGGGSPEMLETVKRAASYFGTAFQIADDIADQAQDKENERIVNVATVFGPEVAERLLKEEIDGYEQAMKKLNLNESNLLGLIKNFQKNDQI